MTPDKRKEFGWCLYDWANSAFATTILAAVLPIYFAEGIVPKQGVQFSLMGFAGRLSATSLWGYVSGITALLIMITAPVLGGVADYTNRKRGFLMAFCYSGALLTALLFFSGQGDVLYTLLLFCLAQYCFVGGNVFYDAFLPFITSGDDMDRVSGKGYALGYLGGGLLLALNVLFIQFSHIFGFEKGMAVRISLASAGLWWGAFGTISFYLFRERGGGSGPSAKENPRKAIWVALKRTWETTKMIARFKHIAIFLVAYMIYNDGVQTVIKMASIYGKEELRLSTGTLLGTLLMVQFVGIWGALFMSKVAKRFGTRETIMGSLLIWLGVTVFAYRMNSSLEYWMMGFVVAMILGGTQALSRSLYAGLIPREQSAQFFGYFSVFSKFSAIWGPILFASLRQFTGTSRVSILSVSLFFLAGLILLLFVKDPSPSRPSE